MDASTARIDLATELECWTEQVRRFLVARLGDGALAQDLAQEAASRLLRELRRGVVLRAPRAWLFRAARNLAVDEVRRRQPQPLGLEWQHRLVDPGSQAAEEQCYVVGERRVDAEDLLAELHGALDALPVGDRSVLHRYYFEGGSCESLAREDQVSVHAVRVRLHRARGRLRNLLAARATA